MNSTTIKWLAVATAGLLLLLLFVNVSERSDSVSGGDLLLPGLKERINDISEVTVTGPDDEGTVTIAKDGEQWTIREKDGFAADVGKLREVLLALADARKLEEKTSNPERFAQLGLAGPEAGGGKQLQIAGEDFRHAVIVGDTAQSKNRYVRLVDDNQSWLIDRNPELPEDGSGWLAADLLDIDAARIQSVSIRHEDGETIRLKKASREDANFTVEAIPAGRELSYATVANGIGGVLKGLKLDDVRRSDAGELSSTSVFTTFDGLELTLHRYRDGESAWFSINAKPLATDTPETPDSDAQSDSPIDDKGNSAGEIADDAEIAGASDNAEPDTSPTQEADAITAGHAGWQYRLPDYKANLLARRWDDILKAKE